LGLLFRKGEVACNKNKLTPAKGSVYALPGWGRGGCSRRFSEGGKRGERSVATTTSGLVWSSQKGDCQGDPFPSYRGGGHIPSRLLRFDNRSTGPKERSPETSGRPLPPTLEKRKTLAPNWGWNRFLQGYQARRRNNVFESCHRQSWCEGKRTGAVALEKK